MMDELRVVKIIIFILMVGFPVLGWFLFRQHRKEMMLMMGSFLFVLFVAEGFLAIFYPQVMEHDLMFEYDQTLGWRFIANKTSAFVEGDVERHLIEINSMGFRDGEVGLARSERKKVLVLGDSFVSNLAVKESEVFTELMEQKLENVEVMNFGVNGYGQVQEYLLLKKLLEQVKPDVVVLMIYVRNDFIDNIGGYWFHPRPYATYCEQNKSLTMYPLTDVDPAKASFDEPFWSFYKKLNLYWFINERVNVLLRKFLHPGQYNAPELSLCSKESTQKGELMDRTMEGLLGKIASLLKGEGVPFVIAVAPSMVQVDDDLWSSVVVHDGNPNTLSRSLPNDKLMMWAKERHWNMLDLLPDLRMEAHELSLYNPQEQHWNAEGNRVVAKVLSEYLQASLSIGLVAPSVMDATQ